MTRATGVVVAGTLLALALASGAVRAQEHSPASAEALRLFDEAVAVSEQGDFRSALRLFRASYDLVPVPDALYNIGMCQKALGELPGAANTLRDYVAIVGDRMSEEERLEFDALLAEIAPQIGRVIFVVGEPGVTIAVDGIVAGVTPFPTWVAVAPGAHSIIASKVGFAPATITIDVVGGAVMPVALALGAREVVHVEVPAEAQPVPPAPPAECPEPASDPPAASSSDLGPWFWTTVAIAGTSAVGMAITGGLTLKYNEDFRASGFIDADARDTTLELRTVTDVLLGVTLAAVVAGALVFLLSGEPDEDAGEEPGTGESPVAVAILPHGLAIAW